MFKEKLGKVIVALLLIVFTIGLMSFTIISERTVVAEESEVEIVNIGHITDIHYYPTYFCYKGDERDTDLARSLLTDTKLVIESSEILKQTIAELKEFDLDYILVSGDISSNAERRGLIDTANTLRDYQNYVRNNGKPNFQIFVVPGNHDIYNDRAKDYSGIEAVSVASCTREEFTKIFAGLGYPDITMEEAQSFYTAEEWAGTYKGSSIVNVLPYIPSNSDTVYIQSNNSSSIEFTYKYMEDTEDFVMGSLSFIAITQDGYNFIGMDGVLGNEVDGNKTGGELLPATLNWLQTKYNEMDSLKDPLRTTVGTSHHNILPHFEYEENYVKDFVFYNWENTVQLLANMGMRYVFTGHMHASDIASTVTYEGNMLFDMQTGSLISYGAAYRVSSLEKKVVDGKLNEDFYTTTHSIKNVDLTYLYENKYLHSELDNDSVKATFSKEVGEEFKCIDLSNYIYYNTYEGILSNFISAYVSPSIVNTLSELVVGILPDSLSSFSGIIDNLIIGLISEVNTKVLANYTYGGSNEMYKDGNNKIFAYINELFENILSEPIVTRDGIGYNVEDIVMECYIQYLAGGEPGRLADQALWVQDALVELSNGNFVNMLGEFLLDENTGIYGLLKGMLETPLDLTVSMTSNEKIIFSSLLRGLKYDGEANSVVIKKLVPNVLNLLNIDLGLGDDIVAYADDAIEKYYTTSFKTGLGGMCAMVVESFIVDLTYDGKFGEKIMLTMLLTDTSTYLGEARTDIKPTVDDGRLPSMITLNFGDNPCSDFNLVWFTNSAITGTDIQYCVYEDVEFDSAKATLKRGDFNIYAYDFPMFDLGIFSTYKTKEIGRHSISITGLTANTKYSYRIGDADKNLWSEVYSFTTAPSEDDAFEVLLISDLQGMLDSNYKAVDDIYKKIDAKFNTNFILNMGDFVDSGKNMTQWKYALNNSTHVYANKPMMMVTGNHEEKAFDVTSDENYIPSSENVFREEYNYMDMHFDMPNVPEQDLTTGVYYSFDYSNVHFTILNTNDIVNDKLSEAQMNWLKNDLSTTTKKFKVVAMHKGIYTAGAHTFDNDIIEMRKELTPLFSNYNVNIVLQGHDHVYSESYYIDKDGKKVKGAHNGQNKINNKKGGVLYINLGTTGDKYYNYVENPLVPILVGKDLHNPTLANPTFGILKYDGKDLYYEGYQYNRKKGTIKEVSIEMHFMVPAILTIVILAFAIISLSIGKVMVCRRSRVIRAK